MSKSKNPTVRPVGQITVPEHVWPWRPLLIIAAAFAVSRVGYFLFGVRFDSSSLDIFWQYIDPQLLKTNLLQSLYYLHSQPPLFNLFLGVILKLFGSYSSVAFQIIFLLLGLLINAGTYLVMDGLGVSRRISLALVILFMVSPASILYENFLFYTYPVTAMLVVSALALQRYLKSRKFVWLVIFFAFLGAMVYTRSAFHLVWFAGVAAGLLYIDRKHWRQIALAATVPFLLCVMLYAKNAAIFGSFSSSSWFGMNFARLTTWQLPVETRYSLIAQGKLSTLSLVKPFRSLDTYQRHSQIPLAPTTGIPVLDQPVKSSGAPNLNNKTYLDISRIYMTDAKYVLSHYTNIYVSSLAEAFKTYCIPASSYSFLKDNRQKILPIDRAFNVVVYGQFAYENPITDTRTFFNTGLFVMVGLLFLLSYGFIVLKRQGLNRGADPALFLTLGYIWGTALYITIVGNAFELGENNRFRFQIDPFFFVLLGILLQAVVQKQRRR